MSKEPQPAVISEPRSGVGLQSRFRRPIVVLGLLLAMLLVADGFRLAHTKAITNPNDFVTLYVGSICMRTQCNPYSVPEIDSLLIQKRGATLRQDWSDQLPIYPPTTLALLLPFSFLSYTAATTIWFLLNLLLYAFGLCWLCFRSTSLQGISPVPRILALLLALHLPKMFQCVGFGNPAVMVTGLLLFALFDERPSTRYFRFAAVLLACMLKPPMALLAGLLFLLRTAHTSRQRWAMLGVALLIFAAIALYSFVPPGLAHWQRDLRANIALGEGGGMNPSLRNSPSNVLLNVALLPGYFTHNASTIQAISYGVSATLLALFVVAALRRGRSVSTWTRHTYLQVLACAGALTLLPVYHRFCDIGVLLLVIPWLLLEFGHKPAWPAWAALFCLGGLYFSWERRIALDHFSGLSLSVVQFLYYRGDALLVLLLACVLTVALFRSAEPSANALGVK